MKKSELHELLPYKLKKTKNFEEISKWLKKEHKKSIIFFYLALIISPFVLFNSFTSQVITGITGLDILNGFNIYLMPILILFILYSAFNQKNSFKFTDQEIRNYINGDN